jgi:hypothetical protein
MPNITDSQLDEMLSKMDPKMASHYRTSLAGDQAAVFCMSKTCKGRKIGVMNAAGQWVATEPTKKSGLLSTRARFDGHTGFRCRCGNSSITSPAETGIISSEAPTRSALAKVYEEQQKNPANVTEHADGTVTIDGFKIEQLRSVA